MNDAFFGAFAALTGSVVSAQGSIVTTWLTVRAQERGRRPALVTTHRENLYGDFIEETSKPFAYALTHELEDMSKLVHLYAVANEIRLFAPANVTSTADEVVLRIVATSESPQMDIVLRMEQRARDLDIRRAFSEACRADMDL